MVLGVGNTVLSEIDKVPGLTEVTLCWGKTDAAKGKNKMISDASERKKGSERRWIKRDCGWLQLKQAGQRASPGAGKVASVEVQVERGRRAPGSGGSKLWQREQRG